MSTQPTAKNETEAHILMPDKDAMEGRHVIESSIISTGQKYHMYDRTEYPREGGIYVYYKGLPFPKKGFPFPEAIHANDLVKRVTVTMLKSISTKYMIPSILAFALLPWKMKMKALSGILTEYNRIGDWLLMGCYLKQDRYSNPCRTLRKVVENFMSELGIDKTQSMLFARIITTMFEYDDAYRYRLQDAMTETSAEALAKTPTREVKRIIGIVGKREQAERVIQHIASVSFIAGGVLAHPKIRKAFSKAILSVKDEFKSLQLDNADRYHVLMRGDYDFLGRTFEERAKIYTDFHTHSKCCNASVREIELASPVEWQQTCVKCGKKCEYYQDFPPEVEVASHTR